MPRTQRYKKDPAARQRLIRRLRKVPDAYLLCRDLLHAWVPVNDFDVSKDGLAISRELVCARCDTVRTDKFKWTTDGIEKIRSSYKYPEGYQLVNVPRGVKPGAVVRHEIFERQRSTRTRKAS